MMSNFMGGVLRTSNPKKIPKIRLICLVTRRTNELMEFIFLQDNHEDDKMIYEEYEEDELKNPYVFTQDHGLSVK